MGSKFQPGRGKDQRRDSNIDSITHNIIKQVATVAQVRDNATVIIGVNLMIADFANQRIALPIACEIS